MGACVVRGVVTHLTAQDSRYAGPTAGSATAAGAGGTSSPASARDSARSSSLPLASFAAETRLRDVDLVTARTGLLSGPSLRTILEASAREMARLLHEALTMRQRYMDLRREAVAFARENVQQTFVEAEERGILQGSGGGNGPAAAPTARQSVATALRAQEMRRSSAAKSSVATASGVATKAPRTPTAAGTAEGDDPPLLRRTSVESALVQPSPGQVDSAGDHGVQVLDLAAFGASLEDDAVQQMGAEEEEVRQQLEATPLLEPGESTLTCTQLWLLTTLTVQAVEEDEGTFGSACRRAVGDSVSYPRLSSRALYEWLVLDLLRYLTTSTPFRGPFDCALFPLHQALSKLLARMRALGADQDVNMLDLDAHFGAHLPVWIEMEHSVITEAYLPSAFAREAWTPVSRTTGTSAMLGTVLTLVRERMHDFHSFPGATDPANRSRFALRLITELFLAYAENTCKSLADELQVRRKDVLSALGSDCSSRGTAKPTAKKEVEAARPGSGGPIPSTPRTEAKGGKDAAAQLPFALEFPMDRYEEALARMAVQVNDLHALVQVLPRFMQELSRSPPHGSTNGGEGAEDKEAEDGVSVGVKGYKVRVHVWGARSVPKMDVLSQSDPYVVLRLAGSEGELEASAAHAAWASSYLRDTSRPVWNEFAGGMAASRWGQVPSPDALLRVELWDQNDVLSDTRIGWLDVRMRQFLDKHTEDPFGDHTKPGPRAHWLTLRHPSHRGPRGEVCIDVRMYSDEAGSWGLRRLKEVENTAAETVVKTWFSRGAIGDLLEAMVLGSPFEPSLVHGSCPCVPGVKVDQLIRGNIGEAGVEEAGSAAPWLKLAEEQAAQRIGPLVSYLEAPVTALYAHMDQEVADKVRLEGLEAYPLQLTQSPLPLPAGAAAVAERHTQAGAAPPLLRPLERGRQGQRPGGLGHRHRGELLLPPLLLQAVQAAALHALRAPDRAHPPPGAPPRRRLQLHGAQAVADISQPPPPLGRLRVRPCPPPRQADQQVVVPKPAVRLRGAGRTAEGCASRARDSFPEAAVGAQGALRASQHHGERGRARDGQGAHPRVLTRFLWRQHSTPLSTLPSSSSPRLCLLRAPFLAPVICSPCTG